MSCQSSVPPVMTVRKAGKPARRFVLNIGLLCSKTFDDAIFEELCEAKYGLRKRDMVKMNIKGVFQVWMRDGSYHEVPLKECHAWTREGCKSCPDFAAEHADISTGGIGAFNDWTLTIVRTDLGREIIIGMLEDGTIEGRPGDDDPGAIALLRKLSIVSRRRWPETAVPAPSVNRFCASSLQSIRIAFHAIKVGEGDTYVAGGLESVSQTAGKGFDRDDMNPRFTDESRDDFINKVYIPMGQTAENVA